MFPTSPFFYDVSSAIRNSISPGSLPPTPFSSAITNVINKVGPGISNLKSTLQNSVPVNSGKVASTSPGYATSYDSGHSGSSSARALDYLNADLAKHYKMNQSTAYQEALSNTSYQRAVKDMQAAGLNPAVLFGNGRVSGSDGVYGAAPLSSGSGSSGSYRYSGSGGSSAKLFSNNTYGMISGVGALVGAGVAALSHGSVGLGAMTGSTIATSAAKVLNGLLSK